MPMRGKPAKGHMAKLTELQAIKERFLANAASLWDAHDSRINRVLNESSTSTLTVTFTCRIDESQAPIKATTKIKFAAKATSDSLESEIDPPEQGQIFRPEEITPPSKSKTACKPKRARKKKAATETEPRPTVTEGVSD